MYKITIDISDWGVDAETMTIETHDFDKIEIIKEFVEFQQENGWAADYEKVVEFDDEDTAEEVDEQTSDVTVSVFVFDNEKQSDKE